MAFIFSICPCSLERVIVRATSFPWWGIRSWLDGIRVTSFKVTKGEFFLDRDQRNSSEFYGILVKLPDLGISPVRYLVTLDIILR